MPELPEVENVVKGLASVATKKISSIHTNQKKLRLAYPPSTDINNLIGQNIVKIYRKAKYILLDSGQSTIIFHLGMSGSLCLYNSQHLVKENPHNHVIITLHDKSVIVFNDPRRFGLFAIIDSSSIKNYPLFKDLGPEPLDNGFNASYIEEFIKHKKSNIKTLIMNSKFVVGVGNIYASEILYYAKISPYKESCKLNQMQIEKLVKYIKQILINAIEQGGSTLRDYKKADGTSGNFQNLFAVYGQKDIPCTSCSTPIKAEKIAGRMTYYCPCCQL